MRIVEIDDFPAFMARFPRARVSAAEFYDFLAHFRQHDQFDVYRGIRVPDGWLERLDPSVRLGQYWSLSPDRAVEFSHGHSPGAHDARFAGDLVGETLRVILRGRVQRVSVDCFASIFSWIDTGEEEIAVEADAPMILTGLYRIVGDGFYASEVKWVPVPHPGLGQTFRA